MSIYEWAAHVNVHEVACISIVRMCVRVLRAHGYWRIRRLWCRCLSTDVSAQMSQHKGTPLLTFIECVCGYCRMRRLSSCRLSWKLSRLPTSRTRNILLRWTARGCVACDACCCKRLCCMLLQEVVLHVMHVCCM